MAAPVRQFLFILRSCPVKAAWSPLKMVCVADTCRCSHRRIWFSSASANFPKDWPSVYAGVWLLQWPAVGKKLSWKWRGKRRRNSRCILAVLVVLPSPWLQVDPGSKEEKKCKQSLFCFPALVELNISSAPTKTLTCGYSTSRFNYKLSSLHHNMVLGVRKKKTKSMIGRKWTRRVGKLSWVSSARDFNPPAEVKLWVVSCLNTCSSSGGRLLSVRPEHAPAAIAEKLSWSFSFMGIFPVSPGNTLFSPLPNFHQLDRVSVESCVAAGQFKFTGWGARTDRRRKH